MELPQIFEYAIDQEKKAWEFYERSAAQVEQPEARVLFRSLAKMEEGHRRALEAQQGVLLESGQLAEAPKTRPPSEQEEMLAALRRTTVVLRESNVELKLRQEQLERELELAGHIQATLLPRTAPQLTGLEMSVSCAMAREVGGDFYDYLFNPLGHLAVTIGDVSGKGIPAALLMVAIRTLWRSKVRDGLVPSRVLSLLTQDLAAEFSQSDQFITMLSGVYDPASRSFSWSNAGHWPPLYLAAEEEDFAPLPPGFLPIGLDSESDYELHRLELADDDVLVLFSDGITEAKGGTGELFGEERLRETILGNRTSSAEELRNLILTEVDEFSRSVRDDDQTLMVLRGVPV